MLTVCICHSNAQPLPLRGVLFCRVSLSHFSAQSMTPPQRQNFPLVCAYALEGSYSLQHAVALYTQALKVVDMWCEGRLVCSIAACMLLVHHSCHLLVQQKIRTISITWKNPGLLVQLRAR